MRKLLIWLVMLIIIISLVSTFGSIGCRATKNKIAFVSDRDGKWEIYIMNIDGSDQKRITDNASFEWGPHFSPDGSKIAFVSDRDDDLEIYIMNIDGSNQERLTFNESNDMIGSFSN
jgi:Tol biopolymer transport system component